MANQLQQFEFGTVKRSEIKLADYNPRTIYEENQKKLYKSIKENGLVEPLVWNKRTKRLVSGHQRITVADKIYKKDYDVPVAIIDVDEDKEKKLNVQLNNSNLQGDWDLNLLENLSLDISFEDMGFTESDVDLMFDGQVAYNNEPIEENDSDEDIKNMEMIEDEKDKLVDLKMKKKKAREQMKNDDAIDFYTTIIFPDNQSKQGFYKTIGIPATEPFVSFDQVKRYFKNKE
ncbi:ParB domain protein nuclease [Ligilactobacillus salivarius cp400]|uniref:ParB domain protein nuclease n=1 Tax=Ligilactobacillus salivarius cp400 TaxID=1273133 RepID=V6DK02_9LACO|nr:ParB domain protein nuclease [Ligilactobacillus salivarius cp400]